MIHTSSPSSILQVDESDMKIMYAKSIEVLTYNLPAGSGFTVGFLLGLKS